MTRKGIFKSVGNITTSTLGSTENVLISVLGTAEDTTESIRQTTVAFRNEAKADVLDSIVELARKKREVYDELIKLGYPEDEAEAMIEV